MAMTGSRLSEWSFSRPRIVMLCTLIVVILAGIQFPRIRVDTDPENMLPEQEAVRVFHAQVKKEFGLHDFIVLGIVNNADPNGVFNVQTLNTIYRISQQIQQLPGVISRELISPATKDNIRQGQMGEVVFEWLMDGPISDQAQALRIRDEARDNPMFNGTMVSEDGKALCLYVPIEQKNMSFRISQDMLRIVGEYPGSEQYHITGLPVAEDTFGVEMFKQMAISAPLAGLIIFLLMWLFFRNVALIVSPMLVALATVIITMGLLIGFGFPVHIMSSMIPIFLMPISVLDSVHILSEFFDSYRKKGNRDQTIRYVMQELFTPMLFTSLTSAVGFFSLSFSPIPPVQTFGVFVAVGVMVAWVLTITFIPAYIALMSEASLSKLSKTSVEESGADSRMDAALAGWRGVAVDRFRAVLVLTAVLIVASGYGISKIQVNDNPVRWFTAKHRIRVADRVLNEHFGGTYTAYLVMQAQTPGKGIFLEPEMLRYVEGLQEYLKKQGDVGKSTSLADVVKKVYYELLGGDRSNNRIPDSRQAVAQCLISFENSHKPDDLWHMATPDYDKINIWVQLTSGDNKDMSRVVRQVADYIGSHPSPLPMQYDWAGKTYLNLVWQEKMVGGMLVNFLGSFIIVFFMMSFLFRSALCGLISMVPLTVTILFIYSLLGFFGKDYDMPVAVLSALTLGLSIDFAIHFIQRARELYAETASWDQVSRRMFRGPARAITRNALVVAIGFLPLLLAPLIPYRTVGFFMFMIMAVSSVATLLILPAMITAWPQSVLAQTQNRMLCQGRNCIIMSLAVGISIVYVLRGYSLAGWGISSLVSVGTVAVLAGVCSQLSWLSVCAKESKKKEDRV